MISYWKHFVGTKLYELGMVAVWCGRSDRESDHVDFRFQNSGEIRVVFFQGIVVSFFIGVEELF